VAEPHSEKQADKAPISTHPAFPAIVALWFACLLGFGSLVLPIALLERLVGVTGIAALISVAEPPLGFTARAIVAMVGALGGAAAGLLLARKVARSHEPRASSRAPERIESRECRPIAAHAELGEEGFEWMDFISEHGLPVIDKSESRTPQFIAKPAESLDDGEPAQDSENALAEDGWWQDYPGLTEFSEGPDTGQATDTHGAMDEAPIQRLSAAEPTGAGAVPRLPIDDSPLEDLGLVQLAGRLGAAIERRRALKVSRSAPPAPAPFAPADFEAADPEEAARAMASFFGSKESVDSAPAAPQPSEREFDALPAMKNPFSRHEEFVDGRLRQVDRSSVEPIVAVPAAGKAAGSEQPSAVAGTPREGRAIRRISTSEESPIPADSAFPPSPPRDRAGTERDLRAALATLQRISGAA
jgi:hypothetical protein